MGNKSSSSSSQQQLLSRVRENLPDSGLILRQELFNASCTKITNGDKELTGGKGALVLTADQLWFSKAKPRVDLVVPLAEVTEVEVVHGDKKREEDMLLVVTFKDRTVSFSVKEAEEWRKAVADAMVNS